MKGWPWLSLLFCTFVAIAATSAAISPALAEGVSVTSLGVRSLDGESQLERRATQALRSAARSIDSYHLSDREVSLAQMSLAHGCDEVDNPCLAQIAETLSAERLLYGNMVRSGDKVRISLFSFDATDQEIDASAERTFGGAQLSDPIFGELMTQLVQKLAGKGAHAYGVLRITGNRPGAQVSIDGSQVGTLDDNGELTLPKVAEGAHSVLVITTDGRDRRELTVEVRPDTTTTLRALLTPPLPQVNEIGEPEPQPGPVISEDEAREKRRKIRRVLGWTSVGIAGAFAIATVATWVQIKSIKENDTLDLYRLQWPKPEAGGPEDACKEAESNNLIKKAPQFADLESKAADLCRDGKKLEKLQYVFIGGAVLFGVTGTVLLLKSRKKSEQKSVHLRPNFGFASASLEASYRF